jgi:hypothetical protein
MRADSWVLASVVCFWNSVADLQRFLSMWPEGLVTAVVVAIVGLGVVLCLLGIGSELEQIRKWLEGKKPE